MDRNQETNTTWNNLASLYEEKFMYLEMYNHTYDFFCDAITSLNPSLLEVGCGPGNIAKYILSKRPDFKIFGIDIAPNMVELAKKNNPTAEFAVMDSREIMNLNSKYDGIIAGFCLPYLSLLEAHQFINNAYKLLNNNGLLYLSFVEGDPKKSGFKESNAGRVYFQYFLLKDLQNQLNKAGYEQINTFKVNYNTSNSSSEVHTILIAKKTKGEL